LFVYKEEKFFNVGLLSYEKEKRTEMNFAYSMKVNYSFLFRLMHYNRRKEERKKLKNNYFQSACQSLLTVVKIYFSPHFFEYHHHKSKKGKRFAPGIKDFTENNRKKMFSIWQ
jgi:hypothetical protein